TTLHADQSPKHKHQHKNKSADKISLALKQTKKNKQTHYAVKVDQINLNRYLPLLEKQQWLGKDIKNYLIQAKPRGQLEAVDFTVSLPNTLFNQPEQKNSQLADKTFDLSDIKFSGKGSLHQLSVNRHDYHPPIKQLDLDFEINEKKGQLNFNLQDSAIDYPDWFHKPIPLEQLRGKVSIHKAEAAPQSWEITIADFYLRNPDFQITGAGDINIPKKQPVFADLRLEFHSRKVIKNISDYVPKIMSPTGKKWINEALLTVNIPRGEVIIKGYLNDLPFDAKNKQRQQQGQFEVNFDIDQTKMKPLDEWASIHDLRGHISFTNGAMQANVTGGRLMKTRLTEGQISIPTFRENSRIHLKDLTVVGQLNNMVKVIKASPLGKSTADFFNSTTLTGKGKVAINVQAAFNRKQRNKEGIKTAVYLETESASLHFKAAQQNFDNINGEIYFHEKGIEAEKLQLTYRGQAATLSAKTSDNKRYLDLVLKQRNQLSDLLATQSKLNDLLTPFIQGD
ncbi:MAG TPA: hypothetical protein ENK78_00465, partial [Thiothrix sp.]|nr:hypothetical protein [Thiothrix sp.]